MEHERVSPFIIGVLGDFSGSTNPRGFSTRKFRLVNSKNFDAYLQDRNPKVRVVINYADEAEQSNTEPVELRFVDIFDFEPEGVANHVPIIARLLRYKTSFTDLLEALQSDYNLEDVFAELTLDVGLRTNFRDNGSCALARLPCWVQAISRLSAERRYLLESQLADMVNYHGFFASRAAGEPVNLLRAMIEHADIRLKRLISQVISDPDFTRLEATWRSLLYLVSETECLPDVRVLVFDCTKSELERDFDRWDDVTRSTLYARVFDDGFGIVGGQPIGILVCDYYFSVEAPDIQMLRSIGTVCEAAHTVTVTSAAPSLLGLQQFDELAGATGLASIVKTGRYLDWNKFRAEKAAQRVVIALPRFLLRERYKDLRFSEDSVMFSESSGASPSDDGLWANPAFAVAAEAACSVQVTGWFAEMGRAAVDIATGSAKPSRPEIRIPSSRVLKLLDLGITPLCATPDETRITVPAFVTCYRPKPAPSGLLDGREQFAARLNGRLDCGRLAHMVKVIIQDRLFGNFDPRKAGEVLREHLGSLSFARSSFDGGFEIKLERPAGSLFEYDILLEAPVKAGDTSCEVVIRLARLVINY